MVNFNRGRSGGGGNFRNRPVTMHQAVCDNCGKDCQVPFKPTSGKPIFCSSCFEKNRGSDSRGSEGRNFERPINFEDKRMFDAICDNCGNSCKVPFQPSGGKPVYCSNCFGAKKEGGSKNREQFQSRPQYKTSLLSNDKEQFEQLNNKLDKILIMLAPKEVKDQQLEEQTVNTGEKTKIAKKKPSKRK